MGGMPGMGGMSGMPGMGGMPGMAGMMGGGKSPANLDVSSALSAQGLLTPTVVSFLSTGPRGVGQ